MVPGQAGVLSVLCREGQDMSIAAREGCSEVSCPVSACRRDLLATGGRMSTLEAVLALSLLQVSAALVYAMLGWCVFTGNSDARTLWTEVFRVLEVGLVTGALCPPLWGLVKRIGGLRIALRVAFLFL